MREKLSPYLSSHLLSIVDELESTMNGRVRNLGVGLCHNVGVKLTYSEESAWIRVCPVLYKEWPKYSGIPAYPVPSSTKDPDMAYWDTDDMYDTETQYGRDRLELAQFMIDTLKAELKERDERGYACQHIW